MNEYESRLGLLRRFLENRKKVGEVRTELTGLIRECDRTEPEAMRAELTRILEQLTEIEENS